MSIQQPTGDSLPWKIAWIIASAVLLVSCVGDDNAIPPPAGQPTFTSLGFLPGDASSQANAVSSDGAVVVGTSISLSGNRQAFRWTAQEGMIGLGFLPGGTSSNAGAVSANGAVVVGDGNSSAPPGNYAFRWTASTPLVRLDPLAGSYLCAAGGVSGNGSLVAGTCLTINDEAFRWTESTGSVSLGQFGGGSDRTSSAAAVSSDGAVMVGAGHPVLTGAVMWLVDGGVVILGHVPGDIAAWASAVSRDGTVVVGSSTDVSLHSRAFRWTQQTGMVALAESSGTISESLASGVSGDGQLVVGRGTTPAGEAALMWDAQHGMRLLEAVLSTDFQTEIRGWKLTRATAISDDGHTIVGYGTNPSGQTEAWVLRLPD